MRLTTKIILEIIGGIFLLSLLLIIGFSFTDRKDFNSSSVIYPTISVSQENRQEIETGNFKTVYLDCEAIVLDYVIQPKGEFHIRPIQEGMNKPGLSVPAELAKYITVSSVNDTLKILIEGKKLYENRISSGNDTLKILTNRKGSRENKEKRIFHLAEINNVNFYLNSQNVDMINKIQGISLRVNDIKEDIKINSSGIIYIDSCKSDHVSLSGYDRIEIKNSTIQKLNLDLDNNVWNWIFENSDIQEKNLTGSGNHRYKIAKNEVPHLNWNPKNKDAVFNLEIVGDSAKLVFE